MQGIERFNLAISDQALEDLRKRLDLARWPERETVADWSQGAPLAKVQELCAYWREEYEWRRCETMLNGFGQYRAEFDGVGIHFLHVRSPEPGALPLLLTHGWPGSVIEFHKVIGPLSDPVAHGGQSKDAFHLVIPSLPGYGFSDKPASNGWGVGKIAETWLQLMKKLGYQRFVAQGGDWGATVTSTLGVMAPPELQAIHLNMPLAFPNPADAPNWTAEEAHQAARFQHFLSEESGYSSQQRTRPQTLGYGLVDSPTGQAAWIYEKFYRWADCQGDPRNILTFDEMLDNIMLYWLPGNGASSARLYWESMATAFAIEACDTPTGVSLFPEEVLTPSRRWADAVYRNIIYWNELDRGGHFAAFEQPELFVGELRACFSQFR